MTEPHSIDIARDTLLRLRDVPAWLAGRGARRPHLNAVRRWALLGVRGVVLPSLMLGGVRYTSREALSWWVAATSTAPPTHHGTFAPPAVGAITAAQRRTLERAGILDAEGTG